MVLALAARAIRLIISQLVRIAKDNRGAVLQKSGDLDGASSLYRQAEQTYRNLNIPQAVATSLENQAWFWGLERNEISKALALVDEAYEIASRAGYVADAADIKSLRAKIAAKLKPA